MQLTAAQIAGMIDARIEGDPDTSVSGFAKIEEGRPGCLSFMANPKYEHYLYETKASVIIINDNLKLSHPVEATLLRVKDAYMAFATLLDFYQKHTDSVLTKTGIEQPSFIHESVSLGKDPYIGAFAYIGAGSRIGNNVKIYPGAYVGEQVTIGDDTVLYAGVKIYQGCTIGSKVILHAGVVIGGDGFGFAPASDGSYKKVPQMGTVIIEDQVEIGPNSTVDRATLGATRIRKGVKIDNLVQVAHNVEIGEGTVIAAQAGISGSTKIGKHCMIGGQAGIVGHITLADGTRINAQSGVSKSVKQRNMALTGSPAYEYKSSLKSQAISRNLPEILQRLQLLEHKLNDVKVKES